MSAPVYFFAYTRACKQLVSALFADRRRRALFLRFLYIFTIHSAAVDRVGVGRTRARETNFSSVAVPGAFEGRGAARSDRPGEPPSVRWRLDTVDREFHLHVVNSRRYGYQVDGWRHIYYSCDDGREMGELFRAPSPRRAAPSCALARARAREEEGILLRNYVLRIQ